MKKKLLTLLNLLLCAITFAQSIPQGINYQALARDASGTVMMNQNLTIQFSVISDITTSAVSWQETHTVSTNDYGLYTAIIGQGTTTNGGSSLTFDSINWGASNHLLKVEVDYGGGLLDMGTTAFMSVPYSLYSANPGPQGLQGVPGVDGDDGQDGQDGNDGQNGYDGTNGTNGIDGVDGNDGAQGNNFAYSTISFTLRLLKDDSGLSVIPQMLSFNMPVNGIGGAWFGWPILPHGAGSSFSNYGSYMGSNSGVAFASDGMNYGEYMPQKGAIYGAAVNWAINSITTLQYKIYAVNYGPSNPFFPGMEITASAPHGIPTAVPGGYLRGSNSVWGDKVPFAAGDYIGIYIVPADPLGGSGAQIKDPIEIEGTLYFRFDNVDKSNSASPEKTW